jgi:hypothetical protein
MSFFQTLMMFVATLFNYDFRRDVPIDTGGGVIPCRGQGCFSEIDMLED